MLTLLLAASAITQISPAVTINLKNDRFVLAGPDWIEEVMLKEAVKTPQQKFALKDGDRFVVWDNRGLTVRAGAMVRSSFLPDIATSPKANTREQILDTYARIERGERTRNASALSGFELLGDTLYVLLRWDDSEGRPWMEALVKVGLKDQDPRAIFVGRMPGLSRAKGPVSDELFGFDARLGSISEQDGKWGLSFWDTTELFSRFVDIGASLLRYSVQPDAKRVLFVERTTYKTQLAGTATLPIGERKNLAESAGTLSFVSADPIVVRVDDTQGVALRYVETGLEQRFALGTQARMTAHGLLVWSPQISPLRAALFAEGDWTATARWTPQTAK